MTKTETRPETLMQTLEAFYEPETWRFVAVNGVELDETTIEVQYIFSRYGACDEIQMFYFTCDFNAELPSVRGLIPAAVMSEREIVDLFGVAIESTERGLYLDPDSTQTPLRRKT